MYESLSVALEEPGEGLFVGEIFIDIGVDAPTKRSQIEVGIETYRPGGLFYLSKLEQGFKGEGI